MKVYKSYSYTNEDMDTYDDMKHRLNKEISYYREYITYLEEQLSIRSRYTFTTGQFDSDRPLCRSAKYTSSVHFTAVQTFYR